MIIARKKLSIRPTLRPTQPPSVHPRAPSFSPDAPSARAAGELVDLQLDAIGALRAVIGFSTLIAEDASAAAPGRAQAYAAHIRSAGSALQGIVNRMAVVSREALEQEKERTQIGIVPYDEDAPHLKLVATPLPPDLASSLSQAGSDAEDERGSGVMTCVTVPSPTGFVIDVMAATRDSLAAQNDRFTKLQAFKEETTALIVHDLKGPLSAITTNLEVALDQLNHLDNAPNERESRVSDIRGALQDSRQSGARLFRMIANLLDVARSDEGRLVPRPIDSEVASFLRRITRERAAEARLRDIALTCDVQTEDAVRMDEDLVGRVLENLLDNALRYTRRGGKIVVSARLVAGAGEPGTAKALEISVGNDGAPVDPGLKARIFDKYEQGTGAGGMTYTRGLGLYFCRLASRAHGGEITLGDAPGLPTVFRIMLPQ